MALAMDTGQIVWVHQTLAGDAWTTACFGPEHGRHGELSGKGGPRSRLRRRARARHGSTTGAVWSWPGRSPAMLHAVNADSGDLVWSMRAGEGGVLGGIEWGFATDGRSAFVSLSNAFEKKPGEAGGLLSVNLADGKPRWTAPPSADTCGTRAGCNTGQPAAVSAMPGVSSRARSTDTCAPTTRPAAR